MVIHEVRYCFKFSSKLLQINRKDHGGEKERGKKYND